MQFRKSANLTKMRKRNIKGDVLRPKRNSKLIFRIFCPFLNKKWQKRWFFVCGFLKNCDFLLKFNIINVFLVEFPS